MSIPNGIEHLGHLCGGQPSAESYQALKDQGYKTIVSLRAPDETGASEGAEQAKAAGLSFVNIPVSGPDDLSKSNAVKLDGALAKNEGPFVIHCKAGGRVGALWALKAFYCDGKSVEDAVAEGRKLGLAGGLENAVLTSLR